MDCPNGFWCIQIKDVINTLVLVATIMAIYLGPIRAVKFTRYNDERREKKRREFEIFSNLMKTRRMVLDPIHVTSLNLIEVEFFAQEQVIKSYRLYIENLTKTIPDKQPQAVVDQFLRDRDDAFFNLIHDIGLHLGFSIDKRDLQRFSYLPQGWQNTDFQQQNFRRLIIELLLGQRPLPVKQFSASDVNEKFPPPPT
ncbi:MAG: DUF6680 family protein [Roseiarcus sp.]